MGVLAEARFLRCWLLFVLLLLRPSTSWPAVRPGFDLFTNGPPLQLGVEINPAALEELSKNTRQDVAGRVREGTNIYDVMVHLKGAAGSFRQIKDKPALTLTFGKLNAGPRFHGLRKIHLNNSVQDGSYLNELLAGDLFNAAGVPATRVTHALVEINGAKQGLYVVKEGFSRDFLSLHFHNTRGNLYDMDPGREITERLERNLGEGENNYADLKELAAACQEKDATTRWQHLQGILDADRFISFMAMEVITGHWDGYCLGRNNFRVYHDMDRNRMVFFPHGTDQLFGNPAAPMRTPMSGLVAQSIMRTPEGRRRYIDRFTDLTTNVFNLERLTNRVWSVVAALRPALTAENPGLAREFASQAADLCQRLEQRDHELRRIIHEPEPKPLAFSHGIARLEQWQTKVQSGEPKQEEIMEGTQKILLIDAQGKPCVASWRQRILLAAGRYRFEARARTAHLEPDNSEIGRGAGIRISGGHRTEQLSGDTGWSALSYELEIPEGGDEVELVCELRALSGQVWFDTASMRLVQLQ